MTDVLAEPPERSPQTRAAILAAALEAFTAQGYDAVGIRTIAAAAAVSPALVIRYFGGKARLFEAVLEAAFDADDQAPVLRESGVRGLAEFMVAGAAGEGGTARGLLIVVRSAGSQDAAEILRRFVEERFIDPVSQAMGGGDARVGVGMVAALLTGFGILRDVLRTDALAPADPALLVALAERMLEPCLRLPPVSQASGRKRSSTRRSS